MDQEGLADEDVSVCFGHSYHTVLAHYRKLT